MTSSPRILIERGWPNYLRSLKGLPVELSEIDGKWSGHFLRDQTNNPYPELFLYSKTDFYVSHKYLEEEVLKKRREAAASGSDSRIMTKCWDKSGHVAHLRAHKQEYSKTIFRFLEHAYFDSLKTKKVDGLVRDELDAASPSDIDLSLEVEKAVKI